VRAGSRAAKWGGL